MPDPFLTVAGSDIDRTTGPESPDEQPKPHKNKPGSRKPWLTGPRAAIIAAVIAGIFGIAEVLIRTDGFGLGTRPKTPPSPTLTLTTMPAVMETSQPLPSAELVTSASQLAYQRAEAGVTRNADWTPYTEIINGVEMALVPAGCFQMGSTSGESDEQPIHKVCFDQPFWIDVYEVTNEQYGEVAAGYRRYSSALNQPRICITWHNAKAHCESRGARLPTEAEWEYTARGPDSVVYPWGNTFIADNVVYGDNSDGRTWAVGSKPEGISWVGVYHLSGNVWEWVNDWYGGYSSERQVNPTGPDNGTLRVWRGGSWYYDASYLRSSDRGGINPGYKYDNGGFRCALSYQP